MDISTKNDLILNIALYVEYWFLEYKLFGITIEIKVCQYTETGIKNLSISSINTATIIFWATAILKTVRIFLLIKNFEITFANTHWC